MDRRHHPRFDPTRRNIALVCLMKTGQRMLCKSDGLIYQLGVHASRSQFWMLRENPPHKGLVHVNTIIDHFEVVKDEASA